MAAIRSMSISQTCSICKAGWVLLDTVVMQGLAREARLQFHRPGSKVWSRTQVCATCSTREAAAAMYSVAILSSSFTLRMMLRSTFPDFWEPCRWWRHVEIGYGGRAAGKRA